MRSVSKASALLLCASPVAIGQSLDTSSIESMGNNSLFTRWRPRSHIIAPAGWMNVSIWTATGRDTLPPARTRSKVNLLIQSLL